MLLYKTIIRPLWSYGVQIWRPVKPSNIRPIQSFQNVILYTTTDAPLYITNQTLHKDLQIETVNALSKLPYKYDYTKYLCLDCFLII